MREALDAEWIEVQRRIVAGAAKTGVPALAELEAFLRLELPNDLRAEALAFRGSMLEGSDAGAAVAAYGDAHELMSQPSYSRYTVELALGHLTERRGQAGVATDWYKRALNTCLAVGDVSGSTALGSLLQIRGLDKLTDEERDLCLRVVEHSWLVLGLAGRPDARRMADAILELRRAEGKSRS